MVVSPRRPVALLAALAAVVACLSIHAKPAHADLGCGSSNPPPNCGQPYTEPKSFKLTVNLPAEGGVPTTTDGAMTCTTTSCTRTVTITRTCYIGEGCDEWPEYKSVTVSASGGPSTFSPEWTDCPGSDATCTLTMDSNKTIGLTWKDTTVPTITFAPPAKAGVHTQIDATAGDWSGIKRMDLYVDGSLYKSESAVSFIAMQAGELSEGQHTIAAGSEDGAGNYTITAAATVTVDKSVHVTLGDLPAYTNAAGVPLTFTHDDDVADDHVFCGINDELPAGCVSPYSRIDASSPDGAYTYKVQVMDDVDNAATETRSFVLDRTLPDASFTGGPAEGAVVTGTAATLTLAAGDANLDKVTCSADGGAFAPCNGTLVLSGLAAGAHAVSLRVIDKAGNVRDVVRHFSTKAPGSGTPGDPGTPGNPGTPGTPRPAGPRIALKAKVAKRVTTIRSFAIKSLPKRSTVTITCKGKGCAKKKLVLKRASGGTLTVKALAGRKLGVGAKLTITVTAKGSATFKRTVTIRAGKAPLVR
jgi:hypothetical protein